MNEHVTNLVTLYELRDWARDLGMVETAAMLGEFIEEQRR